MVLLLGDTEVRSSSNYHLINESLPIQNKYLQCDFLQVACLQITNKGWKKSIIKMIKT